MATWVKLWFVIDPAAGKASCWTETNGMSSVYPCISLKQYGNTEVHQWTQKGVSVRDLSQLHDYNWEMVVTECINGTQGLAKHCANLWLSSQNPKVSHSPEQHGPRPPENKQKAKGRKAKAPSPPVTGLK